MSGIYKDLGMVNKFKTITFFKDVLEYLFKKGQYP